MKTYLTQMVIEDKELADILQTLDKAKETIYECYSRLERLDFLSVRKESTAAGNPDTAHNN